MTPLCLNTLPSTFSGMAAVANAIPMLDHARENELVRSWSLRGDIDAARELVLSHLRLVIKCVRDHQGYGLSREDMVQEGLVGLMKAVHRFNADLGVRLGVFARHWIVAQIREYIFHNWRIVRLGTGKAMKKLFFGYRSTIERLARLDPGARPSLLGQQVAKEMGVDIAAVEQASHFLIGKDASLDIPEGEFAASSPSGKDMLGCATDARPAALDAITSADDARTLYLALDKLPARDLDILRSRYLIDEPQPLRMLADRHGISIERVRQIEKKALQSVGDHIREME